MKRNKRLYCYLVAISVLVTILLLWNRNHESRWETFLRINKLDKEELPFFNESGKMNSGGDMRWRKALKIASQLRSGVDKKEDILKVFGYNSHRYSHLFTYFSCFPRSEMEKELAYVYLSTDMEFNKKEFSKKNDEGKNPEVLVLIFDKNGYFVMPDLRTYYIPPLDLLLEDNKDIISSI